MSTIEAILAERGIRYGAFEDHALIAQNLQDAMRGTEGWAKLKADQKQALSVIADKIARILNGDPTYIDSWTDLSGYATLIEKRLERDVNAAVAALKAECAANADKPSGRKK